MSMNEKDMAFGTQISKDKKRLAEIIDQLKSERRIHISEVDSSQWNQLVRDAEKILMDEKRII